MSTRQTLALPAHAQEPGTSQDQLLGCRGERLEHLGLIQIFSSSYSSFSLLPLSLPPVVTPSWSGASETETQAALAPALQSPAAWKVLLHPLLQTALVGSGRGVLRRAVSRLLPRFPSLRAATPATTDTHNACRPFPAQSQLVSCVSGLTPPLAAPRVVSRHRP